MKASPPDVEGSMSAGEPGDKWARIVSQRMECELVHHIAHNEDCLERPGPDVSNRSQREWVLETHQGHYNVRGIGNDREPRPRSHQCVVLTQNVFLGIK